MLTKSHSNSSALPLQRDSSQGRDINMQACPRPRNWCNSMWTSILTQSWLAFCNQVSSNCHFHTLSQTNKPLLFGWSPIARLWLLFITWTDPTCPFASALTTCFSCRPPLPQKATSLTEKRLSQEHPEGMHPPRPTLDFEPLQLSKVSHHSHKLLSLWQLAATRRWL